MLEKGSKLVNSASKISQNLYSSIIFSLCFFILTFSTKSLSKTKDDSFKQVDQIVSSAIRQKEFPGCQVLVLYKGQKVLDRSYGYLTYDSLTEVTSETLYDLASITKVAATTLMIMDLYEDRKINLDEPISCYLTDYEGSNKEFVTIRQLLAHNAGLRSYYPFWEHALEADLLTKYQRSIRASSILIPNQDLKDSIDSWLIQSELTKFRMNSNYRYSDLGFMILHQLAEKVAGQEMEDYLIERFYQPLGMTCTKFNPASTGTSFTNIAPTECDTLLRYEQVWGSVHDRNAAILGGVSGHAGLFSNSHDMGIFMSLFLNEGNMNGSQFFHPETIDIFNGQYFSRNRRALGWDKRNSYVSSKVSVSSFGHKGFTGTMVWADPEKELVFIFLSNRIYPNAGNRKLIRNRTRSMIQDVVYKAIETANS